MKPINTSTYDFPTLIGEGFIYVDKTLQIYELAKRGTDHFYFFSRPRRFGKSLLLSTLKALFTGRRELFKGLAIENTDWNWQQESYPVLHLDMSIPAAQDPEVFEQNLNNMMKNQCAAFGAPFDEHLVAATNFENLLVFLGGASKAQNHQYVVLIDEYDAPLACLLDTANASEKSDVIRNMLHAFYIKAKAHCGDMRFLLVTGVSKLAKTSIFSAFNNPRDLSQDACAADLVGYTHEELEEYFHEHIQALADKRKMSYAEAFSLLLSWYDSYQFSPQKLVKIINPVSLGRALAEQKLVNWWEATATSTLIYDALKASNKAPVDFADTFCTSTLEAPDVMEAPTAALLYQGGYLTIDKTIDDETVLLKIPNYEVRQSLEKGYIGRLLGRDFELDAVQQTARRTGMMLQEEGYTETFKEMLQSAFSRLPHDWSFNDEKEVKRYFLAFMIFANADVVGESQHATGRPDAVMFTPKGIYIFEFKYDSSADTAIRQCKERNYAAAYVSDSRPVYYIGVNYSSRRNVRTINDVTCVPCL